MGSDGSLTRTNPELGRSHTMAANAKKGDAVLTTSPFHSGWANSELWMRCPPAAQL